MKAWGKDLHSKQKKAFTIAELLIILLVISLAMAAFLPMMTQRSKQTTEGVNFWDYTTTKPNVDIWFGGSTSTVGAALGISGFGGDQARLLINTDTGVGSTSTNHILFKQGNNPTGTLVLDKNENIGLGQFADLSDKSNTIVIGLDSWVSAANNSIAIGRKVSAIGENSVAIGMSDSDMDLISAALNSVAIGKYAIAGADSTVALGNSIASAPNSIAIGHWAQTPFQDSIQIGNSANSVEAPYSIVIGHNALVSQNAYNDGLSGIAIGANSSAKCSQNAAYPNSIAIGFSATSELGGIAIGDSAKSASDIAISIGSSAGSPSGAGQGISLGANAQAKGSDSIALGYHSVATAATYEQHNISIGYTAAGIEPAIKAIYTESGPSVTDFQGDIYLNGTVFVPGQFYLQGVSELWDGSPLSITTRSDRRLKNIDGEFTEGLDKIKELKPYNYTFKSDKKKKRQVGVIAQDLQKVFPGAVTKNNKGYLCIRKKEMMYAMLNSIKQLDKQLQALINDVQNILARAQLAEDNLMGLFKAQQLQAGSFKGIAADENSLEKRITELEKKLKNKAR